MCGIAGFCDFNKKQNKNNLVGMTDVLHHRGPDDSGYEFFENKDYNLGLGHRRLSIQDLSKHGHQPMFDNSHQHAIIYNGEVYNFKEFYDELESDGISFSSHSDTEVILNLYIKYGDEFVNKLIGMFSIVIYDMKEQKLKIFIDRAGVKPLYYYFQDGLLLFASEMKSFFEIDDVKKEIDMNSLGLYFQYSYVPLPYSIFKNIYKLTPGNMIAFDLNSQTYTQNQYWCVETYYNQEKTHKDYETVKNEVLDLLQSSFNYRMVSDVPVGVFLSGGYDSSAVAAILQSSSKTKLKTFSIGFENKSIDEAPHAKAIANHLGTEHYEYYVTEQDSLDLVTELAIINDEPLGDVSSIPTYLVSKLAKEHVTVALSGDGGDEIFGGYPKYFVGKKTYTTSAKIPLLLKKVFKSLLSSLNPALLEKIYKVLFRKNLTNFNGKLKKFLNILDALPKDIFKISNQYFLQNEVSKFINGYETEYKTIYDNFDMVNGDYLDKSMCIDFQTYMYQILMKVDRASMAVSLESREPLLDHRIIEYVSQIPSEIKLKNGPKGILKDIVHGYIPKELLERPKQGFVPPFENWLKGPLKSMLEEYSSKKYIEDQAIFNYKEIETLKNEFYNMSTSAYKLWLFLIFQLWYKEWMIDEK